LPAVPAHELDEVKRLARGQGLPPVVTRTLALDVVMARLGLGEPEARRQILEMVADLYGMQRHGCGWYIKVAIDRGRLVVISCHPPTSPLRTRSGTILR
jgi:hypothetical protein